MLKNIQAHCMFVLRCYYYNPNRNTLKKECFCLVPPAWVEHALTPLQYYALEERSGTGAISRIYFIAVTALIPRILPIL